MFVSTIFTVSDYTDRCIHIYSLFYYVIASTFRALKYSLSFMVVIVLNKFRQIVAHIHSLSFLKDNSIKWSDMFLYSAILLASSLLSASTTVNASFSRALVT